MPPSPFSRDEHVPGGRMNVGRAEIDQSLVEHVLGHRVTHVEFTRERDEEASRTGYPVDNIELRVCLDNNVVYLARVVVPAAVVVSRGEALAHIPEDDEHYVSPQVG